jgi:hypothetical protein
MILVLQFLNKSLNLFDHTVWLLLKVQGLLSRARLCYWWLKALLPEIPAPDHYSGRCRPA